MMRAPVKLSRRLLLLRKWRRASAGAVGQWLGVAAERRRPSWTTRTSKPCKEFVKAVHDLKAGKVQGKTGTHTLYFVE
jgi:hypothetical protein